MSLNLKQILVPVDFSETSVRAFDYAVELGRVFDANVVVFHVPIDPILYTGTTDQSFRDEFEKKMQLKLDSLREQRGSAARVSTAMSPGDPLQEILKRATEDDVDLIVIGTHGHGPIAHMLMGNLAEKVVRSAGCPVLTVKPHQHHFILPGSGDSAQPASDEEADT